MKATVSIPIPPLEQALPQLSASSLHSGHRLIPGLLFHWGEILVPLTHSILTTLGKLLQPPIPWYSNACPSHTRNHTQTWLFLIFPLGINSSAEQLSTSHIHVQRRNGMGPVALVREQERSLDQAFHPDLSPQIIPTYWISCEELRKFVLETFCKGMT